MDMNNKKNDPNRNRRLRNNIIICVVAAVFSLCMILFLNSEIQNNTEKEISYSKFVEMLKKDEVKKVTFKSNLIYIEPKTEQKVAMFAVTYYTGYVNDTSLVQDMLNKYGVEFTAEVDSAGSGILDFLLTYLLPIGGLWLLLWFFMRSATKGGGLMGVGKSNAKMYVEKKTGVTFADVAGEDEAKESLTELVDFLKNPEKYKKIGAKLPKGALLVGPPGTGKTLLAKALAGEAGVPFFSLSGSDFVEMFVGVGASRVRDLFDNAKKNSPCIIFIDEIDAVGRHRGAGLGGGHDEREQTLNQLLVEMDGFGVHENVIVVAATNRPDILDPALLRPGRFDRQITVGVPDVKGRRAILDVHKREKPLDSSVDLDIIAKGTPGFTGADLENLMNEAALLTARNKKKVITMEELEEAIKRVIAGPEKKSRVVTPDDQRITAYHEAGHAIVMEYLHNGEDVREISIIPRGMAAGYTISFPMDDSQHMTKGKLLDRIAGLLGGRAAEQVALEDICTGASNDIERATSIAKKMITEWGMSERLGPMKFGNGSGEVFLGRDLGTQRDYSEEIASMIDEEIRGIVEGSFEKAVAILEEKKDILITVAETLLNESTISGDEFKKIYHDGGITEAVVVDEEEVTPPASAPNSEDKKDKKDFPGILGKHGNPRNPVVEG